MDVLTLGEKKYVKASVIARELGYTADYVGQLCRGGKVDAKLFGRSWYVHKDSIGEHKSTRYRSTQAKSIQAVKVHIAESSTTESPKPNRSPSMFYAHNRQKPSPRYVSDESPLMPHSLKSGTLRVELAEATPVTIDSSDASYNFTAPKLPIVKFKGSLSLSEVIDGVTPAEEGTSVIHPKEVQKLKSEHTAHNKVISAEHTERAIQKTVGGHKVITKETDARQVTELVFSNELQTVSTYHLSVIASTLVSLAVVVLLLGMETHVFATQQTMVTQYKFGMENLTAAVYQAHK